MFSASTPDTTPTSTLTKSGMAGYQLTESSSSETLTETGEDDLSAYIIPPPPSSTRAVEEQNRVLARFRQVAEEVRRMMAHGNDTLSGTKYSESMNSVSKFCTIPRRHEEAHRPPLSTLTSLVTPVRETHSKPGSAMFPGTDEASGGDSTKKTSKVDGLVEDEENGGWRPQPPPRVKRNSIAAEIGYINHVIDKGREGIRKNSGNHIDLHVRGSPSNSTEHTSQVRLDFLPKTFFLRQYIIYIYIYLLCISKVSFFCLVQHDELLNEVFCNCSRQQFFMVLTNIELLV